MDGSRVTGNLWTVGNDYILKTGKLEVIMKTLKISKALYNQGFSSSLPILTKTGEEYLDGKDIFILTRGIKGNPLSKPIDLVIIVSSLVKNTAEVLRCFTKH